MPSKAKQLTRTARVAAPTVRVSRCALLGITSYQKLLGF